MAEVARKLGRRKAVVLSLPRSFHHVLCVRLSGHAGLHGILDASGGADLLEKVAQLTGLHDLARLREQVALTGACVRVHSPPPRLHLFFSKTSGRPASRSHHWRKSAHMAVQ